MFAEEVARIKTELDAATDSERSLRLEIPGKIRMAMEDEIDEKTTTVANINRAIRGQNLAEIRLKELRDAALSAVRPYLRKPSAPKDLFTRLLDEVVDMGKDLSSPDQVDFMDVEDHVLQTYPVLAIGRATKQEVAVGNPNVRVPAVCSVYTCRRLIDLSLIAGWRERASADRTGAARLG